MKEDFLSKEHIDEINSILMELSYISKIGRRGSCNDSSRKFPPSFEILLIHYVGENSMKKTLTRDY